MQIYVIRITDKGGREHGAGLMSGSALPNVSAWVMDLLLLGLIRPHEYDSMTLHRKRTGRRRVVKWFFLSSSGKIYCCRKMKMKLLLRSFDSRFGIRKLRKLSAEQWKKKVSNFSLVRRKALKTFCGSPREVCLSIKISFALAHR